MAVRVVTAAACLLTAGYVSEFNVPGNAVRGAYDALGASWKPWSQQRNYLGNGFVGGFLYNLDAASMTRPADYSAEEMARIATTYTEAARSINRTRDPGGLDDVNVVMVLSESFSDPEALDGIHLAQDPIPYTRGLMDSSMSGNALAQHIGGGTANMEFEALTGMSMAQFPPQIGVAYQMVVPDYETFPSAVGWFEKRGHRAIAIHPFTTEMYRRREVYRSFGFEDFVYAGTMKHRRRIGHDAYISDAAAYDELEDRLAAEPEPLFVNLVTMQNHMPYTDRYDDPIRATGPEGEPLTEVGQYARGLAHSDRALQGLIARLRRSAEKTVLVFYGDHLPGIYPDSVFESNGERVLRQTPFFVWANFPGSGDRQPTTSPAHFMDLVLERANAAVPPYYALLEELRREVPAMDSGALLDESGRRLEPAQMSTRARQLLHDYRLLQYDLSIGHRYSAEVMFGQSQ
jgi:phosphoglycerol transferase MdoB-like AlkP superfamily enzyme